MTFRAGGHVCIVGAGAAGLPLAQALGSRGCRVTLVEGGAGGAVDGLEDTYRVVMEGVPHRGAHEGRFRGWGGSTARWGGQLWPWDRHEFEARPHLGIAGWPIGFDDVAPYYDPAVRALGLTSAGFTAAEAASYGAIDPGLDAARFEIKYSTWLPWRLRNVGRTIGRLVERMPNVTVGRGKVALGLARGRDVVEGVRVRDAGGAEDLVRADAVVVAAGAIESTRLLLASGEGTDAPGNATGWLGRCFMDHLSVRAASFLPRDRERFARAFSPIVARGTQFTPRMLLRPDLREAEGLLASYGHWDVEDAATASTRQLRALLRAVQSGTLGPLGRGGLRELIGSARAAIGLARGVLLDNRRWIPQDAPVYLRVDSEQLPDPESRIRLADGQDVHGLPRVALDWRVSELDRRTVKRTTELIASELERCGLGSVDRELDPFGLEGDETTWDSYHMMGGTRMARTRDDGVVDGDLRVFGTDNLFVASTSVFPTGGMANPTLTLVALALRLADHLAPPRGNVGR